MTDATLMWWLFALSLVVVIVASVSQAALVYIDRARLRHMVEEGTPRARALTRLVDQPSSSLSTILTLLTAAHIAAAVALLRVAETWWDVASWVSVVVMVVGGLLLLLGQFIGRLVAVSRPERVALALVKPIEVLTRLFTPVLVPLLVLERWAGRALGLRRTTTPAEAEERLLHLVEDNADLEEEEREMIAKVIELGEVPVREVMLPRIDIKALPSTASVGEVMDRIVDTGHSRVPIYQDSIDNVVGVVYAKDLLRHLRSGSQQDPVAPLGREPYFVPETKKVDQLLHEMQQRRVHLAIVADEYGGTAGIITIEDLIEEIVGEIQDEYDAEEAPIQEISETEAIFDARVSIREVNDTLDIEISDDDFDTIGGLIYHELGKVPSVGDEVRVAECVVTVVGVTGRRVNKVRVAKPVPAAAEL